MWKEEKSCVEANSTSRSKFEDRLPSTYSMKIQSLSQLNTLFPDDGYKSRSFSSGKYNWRLVIYPKGNKKDKGSGFLSMYVKLDRKSLVASTVLAYLTFFVYNKKENNFFTIQDVEGKQFSALRPVWGFSHVIPLDTFNDPENGYVFDGDQCEFGVNVMVPHSNWEVVSFDQKPSYPKFSWTVNKFSKLKVNTYESKKFLMGGRNWVIMLYPKGKTNCKFLSLYLKADDKTIKEEVYAQVDMRIVDPFGCNHVTRTSKCWYQNSSTNYSWGWPEFVSLAKLREAYLDKEGSLKVEVEFKVVSTTTYSS